MFLTRPEQPRTLRQGSVGMIFGQWVLVRERAAEENVGALCLLVDDAGAVCRCWNWRDGQRTQASDETPHCMFFMENVDPARSADLHAAIDEMAELAEAILGGTVTNKDFLTKDHPKTALA